MLTPSCLIVSAFGHCVANLSSQEMAYFPISHGFCLGGCEERGGHFSLASLEAQSTTAYLLNEKVELAGWPD